MTRATRWGGIGAGVAAAGVVAAAAWLKATSPAVINPAVAEPAKPVDLTRYLGRWYELARHENRFERGLDAVTADYRLLPDGRIEVINRGRKGGPDGAIAQSRGRAIVADGESHAKLKVSFFGPFYVGTYWVLDHDEDYRWSIVGEPSGRYLWLLARSAPIGEAEMETLLSRIAALGYDRSALRITQHD